jgi:hypothetical protein
MKLLGLGPWMSQEFVSFGVMDVSEHGTRVTVDRWHRETGPPGSMTATKQLKPKFSHDLALGGYEDFRSDSVAILAQAFACRL